MPKSKNLAIVSLCLTVLGASPLTATAAFLRIDESIEGQDPVVTSDFVGFVSATVIPSALPETWTIHVTMQGDFVSFGAPRGLELIDPATGRISDSFSLTETFTNGGTTFIYQFVSDDESGNISDNAPFCGGPSSPNCPEVIETGDFQLAISGTATTEGSFDTYIKSDEGAAPVPEPATLLLLTTGILAAGTVKWRRGRT